MIKEKKISYDTLNLLDELIGELKKEDQISAFYIFGGAASDSLNPLSDLDFAVLFNAAGDMMDVLHKDLNIRGIINKVLKTDEFDLVILNNCPYNFTKNIINTGKLLFCKDKEMLIDFIERTGMRYLDFKYYRDLFLDNFKKNIGIR